MTVGERLAKAEAHLASCRAPEARPCAEWIMAHVLKTGRQEVRLQPGRRLTDTQAVIFWSLVLQRGKRLPLAYVLGSQPFMGLDIEVRRGALVPRPETEEVVAEAIRLLKPRAGEPLHLLEIGTGTGCISIALAREFPRALAYATDISPAALKLALRNAEAHHVSARVRFIQEDLFKPGGTRQGWADLVISNPPYIPTGEIGALEPEVLHEPWVALDGGPDGLDAIRAIAASAPVLLKPGGWLVLEIGAKQGLAVKALLESQGLRGVSVKKDLQGCDRIATAAKPSA